MNTKNGIPLVVLFFCSCFLFAQKDSSIKKNTFYLNLGLNFNLNKESEFKPVFTPYLPSIYEFYQGGKLQSTYLIGSNEFYKNSLESFNHFYAFIELSREGYKLNTYTIGALTSSRDYENPGVGFDGGGLESTKVTDESYYIQYTRPFLPFNAYLNQDKKTSIYFFSGITLMYHTTTLTYSRGTSTGPFMGMVTDTTRFNDKAMVYSVNVPIGFKINYKNFQFDIGSNLNLGYYTSGNNNYIYDSHALVYNINIHAAGNFKYKKNVSTASIIKDGNFLNNIFLRVRFRLFSL